MSKRSKLPGCVYRNGKRWWWQVRLPGERKSRTNVKWEVSDE